MDFLESVFTAAASPPANGNGNDGEAVLPLALFLEDAGPQSLFHNAPPPTKDEPHPKHPLGADNIVQELLLCGLNEAQLTKHAFLAVWAYYTLWDAQRAVIAMLYLGFPDTYGCGHLNCLQARIPALISAQ